MVMTKTQEDTIRKYIKDKWEDQQMSTPVNVIFNEVVSMLVEVSDKAEKTHKELQELKRKLNKS